MAAFSLAALLRIRRLQQDRAAAEVSTSRARAAAVADRRRFAQNSLASLTSGGTSEELRWTAAARAASASTLGDLNVLADEMDQLVSEAAARLSETRAQTIMLEKLEARHDEAAVTEELRREQNVLDEMSSRPVDSRGKQVTP